MDWHLPDAPAVGSWRLHADLNGQDRVYDRSIDGAWFGARTLLDARLGWFHGPWSVELWGRNLTNSQYVRTLAGRGASFYRSSPRPLDLIAGEGRRVGVTVRYSR
jgi:outer membrane receptor protein involved in Fe transport